jgi:DNA repair exonuclease SbcCD nuclease subunit
MGLVYTAPLGATSLRRFAPSRGGIDVTVTPRRYCPTVTRFLHSADWQLGMTRHFLGVDAQARFTAARFDAIRSIGALARAEGCGFVVVAGDVFESNHVERQVVVRALDAMAATPDVCFYLLPGNHDPLDAASVLRSPTFVRHCPTNVVVLDGHGPWPVESGIEIVAAPWVSKRPLVDLVAAAISGLEPDGTVRIVVGHGAIDRLVPEGQDAARIDPARIESARLDAALDAGVVHYVALGDRHSATAVGDHERVWYSGTPEPTDYVETDAGQVLLVDCTIEHCRVERHSVGTWRFVRDTFELAGAADIDHLAGVLDAIDDKARCIVKVGLVGQLSLGDMARVDALLDHHRDLLAALEAWDGHSQLVALPADDDFSVLQLSGFARLALDDLQQLARTPSDTTEVASDALALLYRLASVTA